MVAGDLELVTLTGLGQAYDLEKFRGQALLMEAGLGFRLLYALAKKAHCTGQIASGYFGVQPERGTIFDCGVPGIGDCSLFDYGGWFPGVKGFVTDAMPQTGYTYLYTWWACAHGFGPSTKRL